jgi:site-specific DNA-methyltransferase (adenine-specific)
MKYQIIYADPPWKYSFPGTRSDKHDDYSTCNTDDICRFKVTQIADDNCALFIWGIWTGLPDCLQVIKAWGFEYKTIGFVWVKAKRNNNINQTSFLPIEQLDDFFGMGMWTRSNTEYLLIATKGNIKPISHAVKQVVYAPIQEHSRKPTDVRDRIVELMGDLPRIELFARQKVEGWDSWGNEVESDIILDKG